MSLMFDVFLGMAFIAPLGYLLIQKYLWENSATKVDAEIIEIETQQSDQENTGPWYRPIYRYTLKDGKTYVSAPYFFSNNAEVRIKQIGSREAIFVHKRNPKKIRLANSSRWSVYVLASLIACIGLFILLNSLTNF